jgi:hypothetical protein
MAVFPFDSTVAQRASRAQDFLKAARPALVMRWEQDAYGHLVCRWVFAAPASPVSPPY